MSALVIIGEHPERGRLFVAVEHARYTDPPKVAHCRLGALLAPFPSKSAAEAALADAGAVIAKGARK